MIGHYAPDRRFRSTTSRQSNAYSIDSAVDGPSDSSLRRARGQKRTDSRWSTNSVISSAPRGVVVGKIRSRTMGLLLMKFRRR